MSSAPEQDPAFLDDFYAECDEHLSEIRRSLVTLDGSIGKAPPATATWEALFRRFHSIKGILGLAGLLECERLAHSSEDYLKALSQGDLQLNDEAIDLLTAVTGELERALAAHRKKERLPDLSVLQERVVSRTRPGNTGSGAMAGESPHEIEDSAALPEAAKKAAAAGKLVFRVVFKPSAQLHEKGVNVNSVRLQLQAFGEIVHSMPLIQPGGVVAFEFLVVADQPPVELERRKEEGLSVKQAAVSESASAVPDKENSAQPGSSGQPAYLTPSHIVRVDLSRLDELMRTMGEMVVHRARLDQVLTRVSQSISGSDARALQEINDSLGRELRRMRDGLMRVRLVPVSEIFERMALVVRDLSREREEKIQIQVTGQETQIDKYIVERLKDPMLHLVRNAVSHGLEAPGQRAAAGKPEAMTISLRASQVGEWVLIEVADDGKGIDPEKVRLRAEQAGLNVGEELSGADLLEILCTPGFSTKDKADLGAGRGVGMAVVKNVLMELGGELGLKSERDQGTTWTLRLPLTLAIADALLISVAGQTFAVPQSGLQEITTVNPDSIQKLEHSEFMTYRGGILPLLRLSRLFHLPESTRPEQPVLVIGHGEERGD